MAIIANRVKNSSSAFELIKSIIAIIKRFFIIFLLGISLYIFISAPKKLSNISLEIVGEILSASLAVYEDIFECVNSVHKQLVYFQDLAKKNMELQLELARLQRLQSNLDSLQAENSELKELLTVVKEEEFKFITAKLLNLTFNPFSKTAMISAGKKHGIAIDQVVTNVNGLVGRITEVSDNYAKIMLINDNNSRIPVTASISREKAILAGNGDGGQMLYLPYNHLIQKNERILTSGYGNVYPAGILVGHVSKITEKNEVIVDIAADLSKTEFVQVLLSK